MNEFDQNNDNDIMSPKLKEQISKNWGNFCSSCGTQKNEDSLKFIRKTGIAYQYISECSHCGLKTIITLVPNIGMQVTQVRTDISPSEFDRFAGPVTSNDYLEFYSGIRNMQNARDIIKFLNH